MGALPSPKPRSLRPVDAGLEIVVGARGALGFSGELTEVGWNIFSPVEALLREGEMTWHVECKD